MTLSNFRGESNFRILEVQFQTMKKKNLFYIHPVSNKDYPRLISRAALDWLHNENLVPDWVNFALINLGIILSWWIYNAILLHLPNFKCHCVVCHVLKRLIILIKFF